MSLILEKCRNGFLMLPANGNPADAFILADSEVSDQIKQAFEKDQEARVLKTELKSISGSLADDSRFPTLTSEVSQAA